MAQLYDITLDREITRYVNNGLPDQEVTRITNKALDGTAYLQIIGRPSRTYDMEISVNELGKTRFEDAEAAANLLRVTYRDKTYYGRIIKKSIKKASAGDWYNASVTLAVEDV